HQARLASHVSLYDPEAWDRYQMLVATFMARGADPATAEQQAWGHLYQTVQRQALLLSFIDNFWWLVWIFAAVIPLVGVLGGRPARAARGHHDAVGAIARREPAAVGDAEGAIAVARGPCERLLGGRPAAVGAAHALHEHRGAHDLHHVLGHIVGAERDQAARA